MAYTLYKDITIVNRTVMSNKTNKYIVIHYTGNKTDTAKNNATYFKSVNRNASAHYFVDKTTVYQVVEDKDAAWSVGRNYGSNNLFDTVKNTNSISIEMCSDNGAIADATFNNTVELTKSLMKKYNIPVSNVYRHYDVCSKNCPGWTGWIGSNTTLWNKFKSALSVNNTSNTNKYSVGQYVTFGTSYPNPTSPCGIKYATSGSGKGKITAIVSGQAKYQIDNGARYCNDGDISGIYTPQTSTPTNPKTLTVNATYKVYAGGRWYSEVKNLEDYAGDAKNAIRAIAIKVDNGSVKYRVHVKGGGWYPYVTGYNTSDFNNGYAGDCKKDIDMVEVYYTTPSGYAYKRAKYRVAPIGKNYYDWQYDNEKTNGQDGYAGEQGITFGKFQLVIE